MFLVCISWLSFRMLAVEIFQKISVASMRMHIMCECEQLIVFLTQNKPPVGFPSLWGTWL